MSATVVTSCDEAGLRAALAGGYSVTFGCDGTIVLTSPLFLTNAASIDATGHDVTLRGGGLFRIFTLGSGADLRLKGLKITGGFTQGPGGMPAEEGRGGAILVDHAQLHATDCLFSNNTVVGGNGGSGDDAAPGAAGRGGAIYSSEGVVRLTNCSFTMNIARGGRGGNTAFVGRDVRGGEAGGAACATFSGDTVAIDCQFLGNQAMGGEGGAYGGFGGSPAGAARGGAWQQVGGTSTFTRTIFLTNTAATAVPKFGTGGPDVFGGALFVESGTARLDEAVFQGNKATAGAASRNSYAGFGGGGAIFNSGSVEMKNCRLTGNAAISGTAERNGQNSGGGGIQNSGWLELRDSLIEANIVRSGVSGGSNFLDPMGSFTHGIPYGGGLWNGGTTMVQNCTFTANLALGLQPSPDFPGLIYYGWHSYGGGIFNTGKLAGANVTLAGNIARGGADAGILGAHRPGGDAHGGGVYQNGGTISLTNATIALNDAAGGTGVPPGDEFGENLNVASGEFFLVNSIVAYPGTGTNCIGVLTDGGHNISSDASCGFTGTGSLNNTDPKLGPLGGYGGPTPTMPLLVGSPAIDTAASASCPPTDQRGRTRPFGAGCDIGAYESSPPYALFGHISGLGVPQADIHVLVGSSSTTLGSGGNYILNGFAAGSYTVVPSSPTEVFIPSNAVVTVGPEQLVNFHSYHSNAVTLEMNVSAGSHRVVFAGETGRTYVLYGSSNLPVWTPLQTNVMSASQIFDYFENDVGSPGSRVYKVESP